jgi:UDPglucose 6-dehydrogenase
LSEPVIFDGRNVYDPTHLKRLGFRYFGIGRGDSVNIVAAEQGVLDAG